jgi:hypothetical protein
MKQRAHAWVALRALKLIDDLKAAPQLVELLCFYLSDIWEGAWLPDTLIADMAYGHIFKMDADAALLGKDLSTESWLRTPYTDLRKQLKGRRLCLELVKDEPVLNIPYCSHPENAGHLPERVEALSHAISDMLKMGDYPLAFYAKKTVPEAYREDLSAQSVKDLTISPCFSARQIAITFFILSHYIADAHMPLHCDYRDYGTDGTPSRRLPRTLHPSIEEEWEKHFPEKETLALSRATRASLDEVVKKLPAESLLATDTTLAYSFDAESIYTPLSEWKELVLTCRVSYALAKNWIPAPVDTANTLISQQTKARFATIMNSIFHDAVAATASHWLHAWNKFAGIN